MARGWFDIIMLYAFAIVLVFVTPMMPVDELAVFGLAILSTFGRVFSG